MSCEKIKITTPFIKLDSFLKFCGAAETGGHAKELIKNREITVNGTICEMRGKKLVPGDIVEKKGAQTKFEVAAGES